MEFKPYPYQKAAIRAIEDHEAYGLFLDMGLGKTVTTLTAINDLIYDSVEVKKVLIIAPKRVAESTWQDEIKKWDHLKNLTVSTVLGTANDRIRALARMANIYIINRENTEWLMSYYDYEPPFDMLILDESSSFKNHMSFRFKALKKSLPFFRRRILLTGTPTSNTLMDLWAQIYILDQGARLGNTITRYRNMYFDPGKRNNYVVYSYNLKKGADKTIYKRIGDICMSMKASDYIHLPKRIDNIVKIKLPDDIMQRYTKMKHDQVLRLKDGKITAAFAASLSNKLLQMANGSVYGDDGKTLLVHCEKIYALKEIIDGSGGQPVLVFYGFRHDVNAIRSEINGAVELTGAEQVEEWNKGKISILLAHPASAGYGLNLQRGGHIIVWYGLTWSLEQYQQANARLYRQGQDKPVIIHHLVTEGTIDEQVMAALSMKKTGQDALMDAVKAIVEEDK